MSHLIITRPARAGMKRCQEYLRKRATPRTVERAKAVIIAALERLTEDPSHGRPYVPNPSLRELLIPFGKGAYLALYRHETEADVVRVLAFRHGREAQYRL